MQFHALRRAPTGETEAAPTHHLRHARVTPAVENASAEHPRWNSRCSSP